MCGGYAGTAAENSAGKEESRRRIRSRKASYPGPQGCGSKCCAAEKPGKALPAAAPFGKYQSRVDRRLRKLPQISGGRFFRNQSLPSGEPFSGDRKLSAPIHGICGRIYARPEKRSGKGTESIISCREIRANPLLHGSGRMFGAGGPGSEKIWRFRRNRSCSCKNCTRSIRTS